MNFAGKIYKITSGAFQGWKLRAVPNGVPPFVCGLRVEALGGPEALYEWQAPPLRELARAYPAKSPVWAWLRSHGIKRPRVGGPSGKSTPHAERAGERLELSLAPETAERVRAAAAAGGLTISAWVAADPRLRKYEDPEYEVRDTRDA
jgi:hypothetical protein